MDDVRRGAPWCIAFARPADYAVSAAREVRSLVADARRGTAPRWPALSHRQDGPGGAPCACHASPSRPELVHRAGATQPDTSVRTPLPRRDAQRLVKLFAPVHDAALDRRLDAADVADVLPRVAVDDGEIGQAAGRDRSQIAVAPHDPRRAQRGGAQDLAGRDPRLDMQL